jgi:hypothetical protein
LKRRDGLWFLICVCAWRLSEVTLYSALYSFFFIFIFFYLDWKAPI